jgi:CheY-like chemotaxis protein
MLTIEIIAVLAVFVALLIYAMVRTQVQRRDLSVLGERAQFGKILIVDDDPDFLKITKRVLESHGYETCTAWSGAEALSIMRTAHMRPDLVLLDVMMDYVTDGFEVSSAMRLDPNLRDIPVIMITSLAGVRTQEILRTEEYVAASAWLSEPVQPRVLLEAVDGTLAGVRGGVPVSVARVACTTK